MRDTPKSVAIEKIVTQRQPVRSSREWNCPHGQAQVIRRKTKNPRQFPAEGFVQTSMINRSGIEVAMHAEAELPVVLVVEGSGGGVRAGGKQADVAAEATDGIAAEKTSWRA